LEGSNEFKVESCKFKGIPNDHRKIAIINLNAEKLVANQFFVEKLLVRMPSNVLFLLQANF
jgi:hypothetical protein